MSWSKAIFWIAFCAIAALAFMPTYDPLPDFVSLSDVLNHFTAFFTLFLLHAAAYPDMTSSKRLALFLVYGLFIEAVQYFLPTRDASLKDFAVDAAALIAALVFVRLYRRLKPVAV